eukprot:g26714.t1
MIVCLSDLMGMLAAARETAKSRPLRGCWRGQRPALHHLSHWASGLKAWQQERQVTCEIPNIQLPFLIALPMNTIYFTPPRVPTKPICRNLGLPTFIPPSPWHM